MKRNDFTGTGKVFGFTLRQLVTNRANLISLLITGLIMILMFPAMTLLEGAGNDDSVPVDAPASEWVMHLPSKIILTDETGLSINLAKNDYADTPVESAVLTNDTYAESVDILENEAWVHLYQTENGYFVDVYGSSEVTDPLAAHAIEMLDSARYEGIDGLDVVNAPYNVSSETVEDFENSDESDGMGAYYVQLIYSILVMVVSLYASSYIVQTVVEEKTSRLVETLMISVRPLALILGKILAVMIYVFAMMAFYGICGVLSNVISRTLLGGGSPGELLGSMGIPLAELNINPGTVAVAVFSLLLGYMTYSLLSGMTGAGCSEPEDMQSANSTSLMIIMGCYMIALITSMAGSPVVAVVTSLIPMISIFCAPIQFMMGNIGMGVLVTAWILQFCVIALLAVMCAKIYEELIIYKGKRLTFGQIVKMAMRKEACR